METLSETRPVRKLLITRITKYYLTRLVIRSLLFMVTLTLYLIDKSILLDNIYSGTNTGRYFLLTIWLIFIVEMVFRFFPSRFESIGSLKQFGFQFRPNNHTRNLSEALVKRQRKSIIYVAVVWIILNGIIAALFYTGVIDAAILIIISLFFAVSDIICILFYCPFQSLIMKNRCCVNCRIFNWDFLMMFTPLVFVASFFTLSLFSIALVLFIKWELTYHKHPERFYAETNNSLSCVSCQEKLCFSKLSGAKYKNKMTTTDPK